MTRTRIRNTWRCLFCFSLSAAIPACKPSGNANHAGSSNATAEKSEGESKALSAMLLASEPADAKSVAEVKRTAKIGDEVLFRGRVGGRTDPLVADRAIMTVADMELVPCNARHGDACPTPWDYCCETPEDLKSRTITVQAVGTDGKPLKADWRGAGIKPLGEVVVRGRIASLGEGQPIIVNATGIHIKG